MKYLNEQKKRVELSRNAKYTINAQYTIHVNHPKKSLKGEFAKTKGNCPDRVHSDQMVLGTMRKETGPCETQPKALKAKLTKGGHQARVHLDQMVLVMARW